jgi:hypothetical protein
MKMDRPPDRANKEKHMRYPVRPFTDQDLCPTQRLIGSRRATPTPHAGYPVFTPRREIYVLHGELGRIIDISMGGIRFTYSTLAHLPATPPAEGMLFTDVDDCLTEIPLQLLSDRTVFHLVESEYLLRERKACFGDLSGRQARKLERFLLKNVHIPRHQSSRPESANPLRPPAPCRIGNGLRFLEELP